MATQTKRPRGRETRQALIQAGVEEINRHGVTEFSVRRIAQICGVSCGAPYKHFGDRREFIAAVIEYVNDQWRAEQTKILTAYEGDLQKQLVEVSTGYVKFLVEHPHLRAILTLKDGVITTTSTTNSGGSSAAPPSSSSSTTAGSGRSRRRCAGGRSTWSAP